MPESSLVNIDYYDCSSFSVYWDYAMTIRLEEIVYLHCHQQGTAILSQGSAFGNFHPTGYIFPVNSGGTVVLVSQDGIQRPPLHFPKGGHLLQFLTCLETGLLPHGQLDPPLWNQRGKVGKEKELLLEMAVVRSFVLPIPIVSSSSQGKVFPKLRKRSPHGSCDSVSDKEDDEATDYVFRILFPGNQMEFSKCFALPPVTIQQSSQIAFMNALLP